jgi:hypothetical protein
MTANAAFERLWDAALSDFPPDYSILSDAQLDAAGLLPLVQRAFAGEVVALPALCYDMARVAGRGRACWTDAHLYPVRGPSGSVECVVLTHTDASDRVEAEAARLRAAARAERLQALTAALSVAATPDEVAAAVLEHAASVFGAVGIVIARLSDDGSQLALMRAGRCRTPSAKTGSSSRWRRRCRWPTRRAAGSPSSSSRARPGALATRDAAAARRHGASRQRGRAADRARARARRARRRVRRTAGVRRAGSRRWR